MTTIAELKAIAHAPAHDLDGPSFCQYDTDACPACGRLEHTCCIPFGQNTMIRMFKAMRERKADASKSPAKPQKP